MRTTRSDEHRALLHRVKLLRRRIRRAEKEGRNGDAQSLQGEIEALKPDLAWHDGEFRQRLRIAWDQHTGPGRCGRRGNIGTLLKRVRPDKASEAALRQRRRQEARGDAPTQTRAPEQTEKPLESPQPSLGGRARTNSFGTPESECWPEGSGCRDPFCGDWKHTGGPGCNVSGKYAFPKRGRR